MQGLIDKIAKIDEETLQIAQNAEAEKKIIEKEMKKRTAQYDEELAAETEKKVAEIKRQLSKKADEELAAHEKAVFEEIKRIEDLYEARHSEIAKGIFDRIVGA